MNRPLSCKFDFSAKKVFALRFRGDQFHILLLIFCSFWNLCSVLDALSASPEAFPRSNCHGLRRSFYCADLPSDSVWISGGSMACQKVVPHCCRSRPDCAHGLIDPVSFVFMDLVLHLDLQHLQCSDPSLYRGNRPGGTRKRAFGLWKDKIVGHF